MEDYSEGIGRIARALIPDPPGTREKKELHEQAGRAIVELSNAENLLAAVFCILSLPVDLDAAKESLHLKGLSRRSSSW